MTSRLSTRRARRSCAPCQSRAYSSSPPVSTSSTCFKSGVQDETTRSRTMRSKVMDDVDTDETAIASINSLSSNADVALVAAGKNGDRKSFEILVERHEQKLFFVVQRIARTREDAEDVVQQTFQKAFIHLRKFEGRSAFSTWLTRIAITEALMLLRRNRGLRE